MARTVLDCPQKGKDQMTTFDNRHSRFVAHAKVVLPLAALGLLSTLFLFYQGTIDPNDTIVYADIDVTDLAKDENIRTPRYAGVTDDGTAISIKASEITPSQAEASAQGIETRFETKAGLVIDIRARTGSLNTDNRTVSLAGGAVLQSSTGFVLTTETIQSSLDVTDIALPSALTAVGPFGQIEAGSATLSDQHGAYVLDFQDSVRLLYTPRN